MIRVVEQLSKQGVSVPRLYLRSRDRSRKGIESYGGGAQRKENGGRNYNHRTAPVNLESWLLKAAVGFGVSQGDNNTYQYEVAARRQVICIEGVF